MGCASLRSDVLPQLKSGGSTSGVGCSYLCNRVVPPLMVLLPLYPTSEVAPATEFGTFYHRIRTATQEPESFHIRNPICPTSESESFHHQIRTTTPPNPSGSTSEIVLSHHLIRPQPEIAGRIYGISTDLTSFSARFRKARPSGREDKAAGSPSSPFSRMLCTIGIWPRSGTPYFSAILRPPSLPKI